MSSVSMRAKKIAQGMTVTTNTIWQKIKLGRVKVNSSPQFRQTMILLAGERNVLRSRIEGRNE